MKILVKIIASFLYVGYLPIAPGTFGSLAGLLIAWFFTEWNLYFFIFLSSLGFLVCKVSTKIFDSKDPSYFVMDEVCGMMLSLLWIPRIPVLFAAGFVLFRLADTLKPWPISLIQKSQRPSSIMEDDLAAGLFVNLLLQIVIKIFRIA